MSSTGSPPPPGDHDPASDAPSHPQQGMPPSGQYPVPPTQPFMGSPPPAPATPIGEGGQVGTAGLGVRFAARVLDGLIVGIPFAIVMAVLGIDPRAWTYALLQTAVGLAYFVLLESSRGATPGKRLLGMRVVDAAGDAPSTEVAFKRNAWVLLGLLPGALSILSFAAVVAIAVTIGTDAHNRGWHDKFADTGVLR